MSQVRTQQSPDNLSPIISASAILVNSFSESGARDFRAQVAKRILNPSEPILVEIDSYGGEVYALMSMLDTLSSAPNEKVLYTSGKAMSCGAVLLAAGGSHRYAEKHSTIMVHEVSSGAGGNVNDIKISVQEAERLNSILLFLLAKRSKKSLAQIKSLFSNTRRDVFLTAQEALEFGFIDGIGTPRLKPKLSWEIGVFV